MNKVKGLIRTSAVAIILAVLLAFVPVPHNTTLASSTLTLRPNGAGDETSIDSQWPGSTYHWDKVDEEVADDDNTRVQHAGTTYTRDLYALPNHTTETGTINFIKIYIRIKNYTGTAYAKPSLKSDGIVTDGTEITHNTGSYTTYSQTWTTNPADSAAWEWADIDALQIGVSIKNSSPSTWTRCTQVYVEVDYTSVASPTLDTNSATSVEETAATLDGDIDDDGGLDCDYRGFVWDTSTHSDPGDTAPAASDYTSYWTESGTYNEGNFTHGVSSLTNGELYYYRACAHNSEGWAYGDEVTFLTKPEAPTSFDASAGDTEVTLTWTKGTGAQKTYIRGEDGSYPDDRADGYLVYNDTGVTVDDTGLTNGHTYYYRAWSYATEGGLEQYSDSYGQDYDTPSAAPIAPTITNGTGASLIEDTTARLNGNLTDDGNATTTVTVYWGDNDGGTTPGSWDYNHSLGEQSEGALYYDVTSLPTGTTIYYTYYAVTSEGSDWADRSESFLTKPAAPTNVSATDGDHTAKGVITWPQSPGAPGEKV